MIIGAKMDKRSLADLQKNLRGASDKVVLRILPPATRAAARQVVNVARSNVPKRTGQLKKSLGLRVKTYRKDGKAYAAIGARSGFKIQTGVVSRGPKAGEPIYSNPTQYLHLVERGTSRSAAHPFLRPALDSTESAQFTAFAAKAKEQFDKINFR
jgi:HK97 gp10 family phage protein